MKAVTVLLLCVMASGCAHAISRENRVLADRTLQAEDVMKNPEAYKGRLVIIGGNIVNSRNSDEGAIVEVVQKPLDYRGRPADTDKSAGRFIIVHDGYLDPELYRRGKDVTVAGEVTGVKVQRLQDLDYRYAVIRSRELCLIDPWKRSSTFFSVGVGVGVHR